MRLQQGQRGRIFMLLNPFWCLIYFIHKIPYKNSQNSLPPFFHCRAELERPTHTAKHIHLAPPCHPDPSTNGYGKETVNGVTPNGREQVDDRGRADGTGRAAPTKALLYTATVDNPNFYLSPTMEDAADTIASSVGPSGPNHEYLFLLSEYLHQARRF